jgi:head-tail adaptor
MSLRGLMCHRIDLERKTVTKDASGGKVDSWAPRALAVPCRIEPASATKVINFDKLGMQVSHVVYLDSDRGVSDLDRIKYVDRLGRTRYLEIRGAKDTDELGRLIELWAQEVPT